MAASGDASGKVNQASALTRGLMRPFGERCFLKGRPVFRAGMFEARIARRGPH
jgi:hypothetical protein